jgi:hypothetical protein
VLQVVEHLPRKYVGPEFKPQHCQKNKKRRKLPFFEVMDQVVEHLPNMIL